MALFSPDSSCMVATIIVTHPHNTRATAALSARIDDGHTMVIIAHTLLETYSTLTRMPAPARISPLAAITVIRETFLSDARVVSLSVEQYLDMVNDLAASGTVGGQVYDAAIVACARHAGVSELLTFNQRHFRPFEGDGLTITAP